MKRRDFIRSTVGGVGALGSSACATHVGKLVSGIDEDRPTVAAMEAHVARVDDGLRAIQRSVTPSSLVPAPAANEPADLARLRGALEQLKGSMYVYAMFDALPTVGQLYPPMQRRIRTHCCTLDRAFGEIGETLGSMPARRCAAIQRGLRGLPSLSDALADELRPHLAPLGVAPWLARRARLATEEIEWRIRRESLAAVGAEYCSRLTRLRGNVSDLAAAQRSLEARFGSKALWARHRAVARGLAHWESLGVRASDLAAWEDTASAGRIVGGALLTGLGVGLTTAAVVYSVKEGAGWLGCLCISIPLIGGALAALIGGIYLMSTDGDDGKDDDGK